MTAHHHLPRPGNRVRLGVMCALLAAMLGACGADSTDADTRMDVVLQISDGYLRLPPPGAEVAAGYLSIRNAAGQSAVIDALSSAAFARVEVHEMRHADGMMQMRRLPKLEIEAGETVQLEPHGKHLMLFGPAVALEEGDTVTVQLQYRLGERQGLQTVELPVRRP